MPNSDQRTEIFQALRQLMLRAAPQMRVAKDAPSELELHAPWPNPRKPSEPMWFGGVKAGKAYVSYHLMPLYVSAELAASVPDPLRRRMQGKSCFNFTAVDEARFTELEELTARCACAFERP